MVCPNCLTQLSENALFCDQCGKPVENGGIDYDRQLKIATQLLQENRLKEADNILFELYNINPDNPVLLNNLGFLHKSHGNKKKAKECFSKALKLDPNFSESKLNLASLDIRKQKVFISSALICVVVFGASFAGWKATHRVNAQEAQNNTVSTSQKQQTNSSPSAVKVDNSQNNTQQNNPNDSHLQGQEFGQSPIDLKSMPNISLVIKPAITEPLVQDAINAFEPNVEARIKKFIESNKLQRLYPIQFVYDEDQQGNILTDIVLEHKYGSGDDISKIYSFTSLNQRDLGAIYTNWYLGIAGVSTGKYGNIASDIFSNQTMIWLSDREKGISVGVGAQGYGNTFQFASGLRFNNNGSTYDTKPLVENNAQYVPLAIGNSKDGSEWKPIDDFFGIPFN